MMSQGQEGGESQEQVLFGDTFAAEFTVVAGMLADVAATKTANTKLLRNVARRFNVAMPDLPDQITNPNELEGPLVVDTLNWMMHAVRAGEKEVKAATALKELEERYQGHHVQVSVLREEAPAFIEIVQDPGGKYNRTDTKIGGQISGKLLAICPEINVFTVLSVSGGLLDARVELYDVEFMDPLTGMEGVDVRFLD